MLYELTWKFIMDAMNKLVFAMVCVLCLPALSESKIYNYFSNDDLVGVQALWAEWNKSTPDLANNLALWHSRVGNDTDYPCCYQKVSWQGVSCLTYTFNMTSGDEKTWIIGLSFSNASLTGILPTAAIQNFHYMTTLSLTGNRNLTGTLPTTLQYLPLNTLDLHDNNFYGDIPAELQQLSNLQTLDLSGNQLSGLFPYEQFRATRTLLYYSIARNHLSGSIPAQAFENLTKLTSIDLSRNNFSGPVPDFWMLPKLKYLCLDNNQFSGTLNITEWASLTTQGTKNNTWVLESLSIQNNNITDCIYDSSLMKEMTTVIYLQGTPYCNDMKNSKDDGFRCYCQQQCYPMQDKTLSINMVITIASSTSGLFLSVVILIAIIFVHQSRKKMLREFMKKLDEADVNPIKFSYNALRLATKNFHDDMKLGAGGFGVVYKVSFFKLTTNDDCLLEQGVLSNKNIVAVKQLYMESRQITDEFINEIVLITNLQHRNLVHLKGYSLNGKEMLLVYDYIDNYDLEKFLHGVKGKKVCPLLDWQARYKICLGVAQGLYYLHASTQPKIIHRDIKASNILLDKELNAKIADFGLAREFVGEESQVMTQKRVGTQGYWAPEYMMWGQLSEKTDVYSFGVLLLEIVSGKRTIDISLHEEDVYLPNRAWKLHRDDRIVELLDPELRVTTAEELMEVQRTLETALMCIQAKVEMRPNMFTVLSMLLGESNMAITIEESHEDWLPDFTATAYSICESHEHTNDMSSDSQCGRQLASKESMISIDPLSRSRSGDSGDQSRTHLSSESATDQS